MKKAISVKAVIALVILTFPIFGASGGVLMTSQVSQEAPPGPGSAPVASLPFEFFCNEILLRVKVNDRGPFWFLLDTGNPIGIIDMSTAKSVGLEMQGTVPVGGAGGGSLQGAIVKNGEFEIPGVDRFKGRISLAIPLEGIKPRLGHEIDGLLGADFIGRFVVEIDYYSKVIRLYDPDRYVYSGQGESIPLIRAGGRPSIHARIRVPGHEPIAGTFVVDLGSGLSLTLTNQFVRENGLLDSAQPKLESTIGVGAGGKTAALVGRVGSLEIGRFVIPNPVTSFSQDTQGAMATSALFEGNIGTQIMRKFKVILDYKSQRIILEPNPSFHDPLEFEMSGMNLVAEGPDFKHFKIVELIDHAPAAEAGLKIGDEITAIDGQAAMNLNLDTIHLIFVKPGPHQFRVKRGENEFQVKLEFRRLV